MAFLARTSLLRAVVRQATVTPTCSMYENPWLERHKNKRNVTPGHYKTSTALTGLFVNEHPHHALEVVYGRILRALQEMPADYIYRTSTAKVVNERLQLVKDEADIATLEEKIGMGQIEEVIEQAELELQAARALITARAWEPLVEQPHEAQWKWPIG